MSRTLLTAIANQRARIGMIWLGGQCIPIDSLYLSDKAQQYGVESGGIDARE